MTIEKIIASVNELHGGEREQRVKRESFLQFLNRRDRAEFGADAEHILLKKTKEDK